MYLVVNLGLKSIRAIVFDENGKQVYGSAKPVHTVLFHQHVEQDPYEWIELLDGILHDIKNNTELSEHIRYITSTTSSSCILGVDADMKPITKVKMVSDKRAVQEAEFINSLVEFGKDRIKNTLICSPSSIAAKALWVKNHRPAVFSKVRYWLGAEEFLNYYFTGEIFTDPLNAGKAFYHNGGYHKEVFEAIGISIETLPPVVEMGTKFPIVKNIAEKYNFNNPAEYILTTYDAICAVIGSSNGEPTNACDVSGTVTSVRVLTKKPLGIFSDILLNQKINTVDRYLVGASNNLGGGIIEWYKQAFFDADDTDVYSKMENQCQLSKVGSGGIIFLPYLLGERAPFIDADARGTFFGISRNSTIIDFTRSVFESAGYVTKDLLSLIVDSGFSVDTITVSGGMARFDTINQIKSDVTNKPVMVVENFESTAVGAFILMAIITKLFESFEAASKKVVQIRKIIHPSPKNHEIYSHCFSLYKELNVSLEKNYQSHKIIRSQIESTRSETVRNL